MQTVQFTVNDNYLQIVVSILKNLKQGMIRDLSIINNENQYSNCRNKVDNTDMFFDKFQIDMSSYKFNREEANER